MKTHPLTSNNRALIPALRVEKGSRALRMVKEFPSGQWKSSTNTLNDLIKRIEHLKEVLQTCWEKTGQDVIDHTIEQFHKLLSNVVATTLSAALTNILDAICTLTSIILMRFVVEILDLDNKTKQSGLFCTTLYY